MSRHGPVIETVDVGLTVAVDLRLAAATEEVACYADADGWAPAAADCAAHEHGGECGDCLCTGGEGRDVDGCDFDCAKLDEILVGIGGLGCMSQSDVDEPEKHFAELATVNSGNCFPRYFVASELDDRRS